MRVKAIKEGSYYGVRIRAGVEFEARDGLKSKWFVPVADYVPEPEPDSDKEPETFTEMNRAKGGRPPVKKDPRASDKNVI